MVVLYHNLGVLVTAFCQNTIPVRLKKLNSACFRKQREDKVSKTSDNRMMLLFKSTQYRGFLLYNH